MLNSEPNSEGGENGCPNCNGIMDLHKKKSSFYIYWECPDCRKVFKKRKMIDSIEFITGQLNGFRKLQKAGVIILVIGVALMVIAVWSGTLVHWSPYLSGIGWYMSMVLGGISLVFGLLFLVVSTLRIKSLQLTLKKLKD